MTDEHAALQTVLQAARTVLAAWDPAGTPRTFVQALTALQEALRAYDAWTDHRLRLAERPPAPRPSGEQKNLGFFNE